MHRLFKLNLTNNFIKVKYDYNLGHQNGQGQISPDGKFNFIHISKNASSEIKKVLHNWPQSDYRTITQPIEHLVILRDPMDRWISSIAEFLIGEYSHLGNVNADLTLDEISSALDTKMFQNLLFDFVIFDGHTLPQCCYLEGLNLTNITFFSYDNLVIDRILKYVGHNIKIENSNNSLTNTKKMLIINKLKSLLENNPKLQQKINVNYWADHQLLNNIKFQW